MWCARRCCPAHSPVGMLGSQSFLHSGVHVFHEHCCSPSHDSTPLRALTKTRTGKSGGSVILLGKQRSELGLKDFVNQYTDVIFSCVLARIALGDIEMLMNLHSCCAGRFFVTLAIVKGKDFTVIVVNDAESLTLIWSN